MQGAQLCQPTWPGNSCPYIRPHRTEEKPNTKTLYSAMKVFNNKITMTASPWNHINKKEDEFWIKNQAGYFTKERNFMQFTTKSPRVEATLISSPLPAWGYVRPLRTSSLLAFKNLAKDCLQRFPHKTAEVFASYRWVSKHGVQSIVTTRKLCAL